MIILLRFLHFWSGIYLNSRRKKEEGRRKKEEGRRKKEEGRRKKEEGKGKSITLSEF
ncbi:MAG: hypothetical protein F6K17_00040 [Okeania sp. SIO3C4]|nr:hypothetical protein [Okeania sp. SIO3B3]NER01161.1 hypothetical protein [Okeania sp. SIO3C4]